jgi:hypothetical protein
LSFLVAKQNGRECHHTLQPQEASSPHIIHYPVPICKKSSELIFDKQIDLSEELVFEFLNLHTPFSPPK